MCLSLKFDQIFTFVCDLLSKMFIFYLQFVAVLLEFLQLFLDFFMFSLVFLYLPDALCLCFQPFSLLCYYSVSIFLQLSCQVLQSFDFFPGQRCEHLIVYILGLEYLLLLLDKANSLIFGLAHASKLVLYQSHQLSFLMLLLLSSSIFFCALLYALNVLS